LRCWDDKTIENDLKLSVQAHSIYPDFYLGYDLVQEEDKYRKIIDKARVFVRKLRYEEEFGRQMPFIFHGKKVFKNMLFPCHFNF
jgi:adenosine deaminase CECR1